MNSSGWRLQDVSAGNLTVEPCKVGGPPEVTNFCAPSRRNIVNDGTYLDPTFFLTKLDIVSDKDKTFVEFTMLGSEMEPTMNLFKKCVAEFLGAFAIVYCGCGAIAIDQISSGSIGHFGISTIFGLTVMVMVYSVGCISGGTSIPP